MELNPLNQINLATIAIVIAVFTVTHFVLRRTFFLPVIEVMERRRERLEAAAALREQAAELVRDADTEAATILERASERASRVQQALRDGAQAVRGERLAAAREENAALLETGRKAIAEDREAELAKLRADTAECVSLACERLLGGVDPRTVDGVVDRLVARRVH